MKKKVQSCSFFRLLRPVDKSLIISNLLYSFDGNDSRRKKHGISKWIYWKKGSELFKGFWQFLSRKVVLFTFLPVVAVSMLQTSFSKN